MLGFKTKAITPEIKAGLKPGDLLVYSDTMHHHGAPLIEFIEDLCPEVEKVPKFRNLGPVMQLQYEPEPVVLFRCLVYFRKNDKPPVEKDVKITSKHRMLTCTKEQYLAVQAQRIIDKPIWKADNWAVWNYLIWHEGWKREDAREWADKGHLPDGSKPERRKATR